MIAGGAAFRAANRRFPKLLPVLIVAMLSATGTDAAEESWGALFARGAETKKPVLVLFRPADCKEKANREACSDVAALAGHRGLKRRFGQYATGVLPLDGSPPAIAYGASVPGIAIFESGGRLVAKWGALLDPLAFASILDDVAPAVPELVAASEGLPGGGEARYRLASGVALLNAECLEESRAALEIARALGNEEESAFAAIRLAILNAREGRYADAVRQLHPFTGEKYPTAVRIEALLSLGDLRRNAGYPERAADAYERTIALAAEGSRHHASALASLQKLESRLSKGAVQLFPLRDIVSGTITVVARASSTEVRRVDFSLDGARVASITRPPFAAQIPFRPLPERQTVTVTGYRADGSVAGTDELAVNESSEAFWVRIVEPSGANASGRTKVSLAVQRPVAQLLRDVTLEWNEREVARFAGPPYEAVIDIPGGEIGVLAAKATLRDGTTADDQRVMNAEGMVEAAGVHLVEVPVIVESRRALTPRDVIVKEEGSERPVERIVGPDEAPLILGVVIDSSSSMRPTILELQEAAVQFVESVMGPRDRAFVLAFSTDARLIQPPTQDAEAVKAAIMSIRPEGLTALHDAFILGLMQFQTTGSRRAMVVFSDGVNRSSRYTMEEVNETARRAGVPVYVIGMTPPELRGLSQAPVFTAVAAGRARSYEFEGAVEELTNLARTTGGSFEEIWSIENVGRIYEGIASELGRQSLVIYRSGPQAKGAWRAIDVRARGRGKLRAPGGVYVRAD